MTIFFFAFNLKNLLISEQFISQTRRGVEAMPWMIDICCDACADASRLCLGISVLNACADASSQLVLGQSPTQILLL
jgi:hypothetical protein